MKKIFLMIVIACFNLSSCHASDKEPKILLKNVSQINQSTLIIKFYSEEDYSMRNSSLESGSYVFCTSNQDILNPSYTPNYDDKVVWLGMIPKDKSLPKDGNNFIYNVEVERVRDKRTDISKDLLCRVFKGSILIPLKKSQLFSISTRVN